MQVQGVAWPMVESHIVGLGRSGGSEIEYICRLKSRVCVTYITFSNGQRKKTNKSCDPIFSPQCVSTEQFLNYTIV